MLKFEHAQATLDGFSLTANFEISSQTRIAILGPSGAGKSTLLSMIAGFTPLSAGRITWRSKDLTPIAPAARPISILFQDQNLFPHLNVADNVGLGLRPDLRLSAAQKAARDAALAAVELTELGSKRPAQLSGGQQSRVAIARTLLHARPILLLDEPFSALGPALKTEMLSLVETIASRNGSIVLMVTHDPADARQFAEETIIVDDGVAHAPVATGPLLAKPPAAIQKYLGRTAESH